MLNKFKSYKFWIALLAAVIVLINALGAAFDFGVNEVAITSIATAVLGIFVILGIVKKDDDDQNSSEEITKVEKKEDDINLEKDKEENFNKDDSI